MASTAAVVGKRIQLISGARVGINSKDCKEKFSKEVEIVPTNVPNKFLVLFDQDDIDFEIVIENNVVYQGSKRGLAFDVMTLGQKKTFYVRPDVKTRLETLESEGRKLHFVSQSSEAGRQLVGQYAMKFNTSMDVASVQISQMILKFWVEFIPNRQEVHEALLQARKGTHVQIFIRLFSGKTITADVGLENDISLVKNWVEYKEGIPTYQQRLVFNGHQLEDDQSLGSYGICKESTLGLVTRLRGGGEVKPSELQKKTDTKKAGVLYERGAICFGEKSDQKFDTRKNFVSDGGIQIPPVTLEFMIKSTLTL